MSIHCRAPSTCTCTLHIVLYEYTCTLYIQCTASGTCTVHTALCEYRQFGSRASGLNLYPFLSPSLLPAIMQHRRTVSDTLLFRRPSLLEELKKDGPSSSHSSRSATPLLALFQPTGEGGVVGQAIVGQGAGSKVPGVVTPQHSPQQQKISPREVCI